MSAGPNRHIQCSISANIAQYNHGKALMLQMSVNYVNMKEEDNYLKSYN